MLRSPFRRLPIAGGGAFAGALAVFQQEFATCAPSASVVVPPPPQDTLKVVSSVESSATLVGRFPVRRIYCVGRNYFDHAEEMAKKHVELGIGDGSDSRKPPFFFQKPQSGGIVDCSCTQATVEYPSKTSSLEFECEMVVALKSGGANIAMEDA
jgi:fumarylpyruvate hydrolase